MLTARRLGMIAALIFVGGCFDFDEATRCTRDPAACADGGAPSSASRCDGLDARLCEGFEGTALRPLWTVNPTAGATVELDHARAYRGTSSLHVHLDPLGAGGSAAAQAEEGVSEMPSLVSRWMRVYLFVPASASSDNDNRLLTLKQDISSGKRIELKLRSGVLGVDNDLAGEVFSQTLLPTDRWVCLVVQIEHASAGTIRISLDDVAVPDLQLGEPAAFDPPIDLFRLGANLNQITSAQAAVDLWMDELLIDDQPRNCAD